MFGRHGKITSGHYSAISLAVKGVDSCIVRPDGILRRGVSHIILTGVVKKILTESSGGWAPGNKL